MEDQKTTGGLVILNQEQYYPKVQPTGTGVIAALAQFERAKRGEVVTKDTSPVEFEQKHYDVTQSNKEPGVHRVEFIIWKAYWICNVEIDGVWHTASFPNATNMAEFLAEGQINRAKLWPAGRNYTNE
jgi:hypothetical protein